MTTTKKTVEEVAAEQPLENGTDRGMWQLRDGRPALVARRLSGHYTIPELESILEDVRRVQVAYEAEHAEEIAEQREEGPVRRRTTTGSEWLLAGLGFGLWIAVWLLFWDGVMR